MFLFNHLDTLFRQANQTEQPQSVAEDLGFDKLNWDLASDKEFPYFNGSFEEWLDFLNSPLKFRRNDALLLITSNRAQGLAIAIPKKVSTPKHLLHWIQRVYDTPVTKETCSPETLQWIREEIKDRWSPRLVPDLISDLKKNKLILRDLLGDHCFWEGFCRIGDSNLWNISFGS